MVGVMNAESGVPYCSLLLWAKGFSPGHWPQNELRNGLKYPLSPSISIVKGV